MNMRRHYYISDDLDELEAVEEGLEQAGVSKVQIHVLSEQDADATRHEHLHQVQSLMKRDMVRSALVGAGVGIVVFVLVLAVARFAGWTEGAAGWTPFLFFAVILLGFCTWEGGLFGIHKTNRAFAGFPQALGDGKHVFFVDLEPRQEPVLDKVIRTHPKVEPAGTGRAMPYWLVSLRRMLGEVHKVFP